MPRVSSTPYLRPIAPVDPPGPCDRFEVLVERACDGDAGAWSRLYQESFDDLFRQLRYLTGDAAVAEELVQESFAQAIASRARYDRQRPFRAWLRGLALNVARKYWRKQRNRSSALDKLALMTAARTHEGDEVVVRNERSRVLYAVLADIPERLAEAFIVREIQGLSIAEAAELLGVSPNNLAVRVSRAKTRIREELIRLGCLTEEGGVA